MLCIQQLPLLYNGLLEFVGRSWTYCIVIGIAALGNFGDDPSPELLGAVPRKPSTSLSLCLSHPERHASWFELRIWKKVWKRTSTLSNETEQWSKETPELWRTRKARKRKRGGRKRNDDSRKRPAQSAVLGVSHLVSTKTSRQPTHSWQLHSEEGLALSQKTLVGWLFCFHTDKSASQSERSGVGILKGLIDRLIWPNAHSTLGGVGLVLAWVIGVLCYQECPPANA